MPYKFASHIEKVIRLFFSCVCKIALSGARFNALCESYYAVAYKLQLDVIVVQIS